MAAQAADATLTLACQGTVSRSSPSPDPEPQPTSVGVILNFAAKTIEGFDGRKYSIRIKDISELDLTFESAGDDATRNRHGHHRSRDWRRGGLRTAQSGHDVLLIEMQADAADVLRAHRKASTWKQTCDWQRDILVLTHATE